MIPGPVFVYSCPTCGNVITRGSLMSGNNFGSKIFSDGKSISPMLPEFPKLTKCKKCNSLFWLSNLKPIGTFYWSEIKNIEWVFADKAQFLEIDDYFNAIDKGIAKNKKEELYIRQQIWWGYNDNLRSGKKLFKDESDEQRWAENISKLKPLFDQSDSNQRIMLAEINRNLGDFETCIGIIESIDDEELNWVKEIIIDECKKKNKWLIELKDKTSPRGNLLK
ncbi:MAG: hypothetical protein J0L62_11650 [Bacteroidetes bacterium]|nr:hypothetical protein [Bacteroidota bacterium]